MSLENVTAFFKKVESDGALQGKVKALAEQVKEQDRAVLAELVKIASAAGFEFTPEEYTQARDETIGNLSEGELRDVTGGQGCQAGLGWEISRGCSKGVGAY